MPEIAELLNMPVNTVRLPVISIGMALKRIFGAKLRQSMKLWQRLMRPKD